MKYTLSIVLTLTIFTTTLNIHNQHHKTSPKTKFHTDPKAKENIDSIIRLTATCILFTICTKIQNPDKPETMKTKQNRSLESRPSVSLTKNRYRKNKLQL